MAQSFDTVGEKQVTHSRTWTLLFLILSFVSGHHFVMCIGWFSRDLIVLNRVGRVLLRLDQEETVRPTQFIIADDCFRLSTTPSAQITEALSKSVEKLFGG